MDNLQEIGLAIALALVLARVVGSSSPNSTKSIIIISSKDRTPLPYQLQKEPSMMIAKDARGRSGRKAQEKIIKKEGSVRTDRSPEIETDVDSSYKLQIKKISTCWKDHSEIFPTSTYTSPGGG